MQSLLDDGIGAHWGIMCSHREPAYREAVRHDSLRESELAQDHCVILPLFSGLTGPEQLHVVSRLAIACAGQLTSAPAPRRLSNEDCRCR